MLDECVDRRLAREITGHEVPIAGELLLAASSIPGEHLLPALLSEFRKKHPRIKLRASVSDKVRDGASAASDQSFLFKHGRDFRDTRAAHAKHFGDKNIRSCVSMKRSDPTMSCILFAE